MSLLIPFDPAGLDPKVVAAFDDLIAPLQIWAGAVDGINAATRLNELSDGIASLPTVPTGAMFMWGTASAPTGYLLLDGSNRSRTTYANLFALWGTTYGVGDGSTTFGTPDMRRRFPMGKSASDTLGGTGGAFNHTHTGPSHTHTVSGSTANESAHTHTGTTGQPNEARNVADGADHSVSADVHVHGFTTGAGSAHSHGAGTLAADAGGTGATGSNNPPYLVVNFIVKT